MTVDVNARQFERWDRRCTLTHEAGGQPPLQPGLPDPGAPHKSAAHHHKTQHRALIPTCQRQSYSTFTPSPPAPPCLFIWCPDRLTSHNLPSSFAGNMPEWFPSYGSAMTATQLICFNPKFPAAKLTGGMVSEWFTPGSGKKLPEAGVLNAPPPPHRSSSSLPLRQTPVEPPPPSSPNHNEAVGQLRCDDSVRDPGWCLVFGLQDRGGGGNEGKKKFVYLKWSPHFWLSIQNFIFPQRRLFGFGWVGGLAWGVGSPGHPPPPHG